MNKIGYKAVRVISIENTKEERLLSAISAFSALDHNEFTVEYLLNKWVYPHTGCGPLCVFEFPDDASLFLEREIEFFKEHEYGRVYECSYTPSTEKKIYFPDDENDYMLLENLPAFTRLATKVKLLKLVCSVKDEYHD